MTKTLCGPITMLIAALLLPSRWMLHAATFVLQEASTLNSDNMPGNSAMSFVTLVQRTVPAVVTIATSDPAMFGEQLVDVPPTARQGNMRCLGSGVLVTADGTILTNHHVISRASELLVLLADTRALKARVIGADPGTDIALLKVDARDLPVLPLGNSSTVRAGELALAIGAPLGLRQSVTMGIVSATGRRGLGIQKYEDFIQTDASINPGSSGGALINLQGELIGILTAGKEYAGLSFAVPVDMVRLVMQQIASQGYVVRGSLGVTLQTITPAIAEAFGRREDLRGALVTEVPLNSPAGAAGLLAGDIILRVGGASVIDDHDLTFAIAQRPPGTAVELEAYRAGQVRRLSIMLQEETDPSAAESDLERVAVDHLRGPLGLSIRTVTSQIATELNLPPQTRGALVTGVKDGSRAAAAGMAEGDIIVEVNRREVTEAEELVAAVHAAEKSTVLLLINRSGTRMYVVVE